PDSLAARGAHYRLIRHIPRMHESSSVRAAAPGRVNLIGEHTDYNGGFVLPTAIPQQTAVELVPRADRTVVVRSNYESASGTFVLGEETQRSDWLDYIQGVTWALRQHGLGGPQADLSGF